MSSDYTPGIRLSAEDRAFHWQEAVRLRALANTITTEPVRARVLAQATELVHALERNQHAARGMLAFDAHFHFRQAVTVGRHHAHRVAVPLEERARKEIGRAHV